MKLEIKIKRVLNKIAEYNVKLSELRKECGENGHDGKLTGKYRGNTGNYDPSADSYWVEFKCPVCGDHWTESQDDVWFDRNDRVHRTKNGILFTKD